MRQQKGFPAERTLEFQSTISMTLFSLFLLLLLILYPLIPLMSSHSITVNLPKAMHPNTSHIDFDPYVVVIGIDPEGRLYLNRRPTNLETLVQQLPEQLIKSRKTIYVKSDRRTSYARVYTVLGVCRDAGAQRIKLLVQKV